jgi:bifunctional enzyme CysN/CysC
MLPGRAYTLKLGERTVTAVVTELKYVIDPDSLKRLAAKTLLNKQFAFCNLALSEAVTFDHHGPNAERSDFVLSDREDKVVVGLGVVQFGLRRATNVHWQALDLNKGARAKANGHKPAVLWFTGLSGSGKSTIANLVERLLHAEGAHTYLLDGDNVRHGLNRDLGFTNADRVENIRRVAEVAKLFADAGLIVIVAFISPFRAERQTARELLPEGEFLEIFVDTPIEICKTRDPKGLYARAERGEIKNFTGIDSPYEAPVTPDIHLETAAAEASKMAEVVLGQLRSRGIVPTTS